MTNNTVYGNRNGGIRLGTSADNPVPGSVVVNNIVGGSPIGIKEPAGSNYTGRVTLDFNDVWGNTQNYALGPVTKVGPNAISAAPGFVDATNGDFRLGRVTTGQPVVSACIEKGPTPPTRSASGSLTAFTDKYPDSGRVDLGYHGTLLYPSTGSATINGASLTFGPGGSVDFAFSGILEAGAGSDGMRPGADYAAVTSVTGAISTVGRPAGGPAVCEQRRNGERRAGAARGGTCQLNVQASGLQFAAVRFPVSVSLRLGDDVASASALLVGTLQVP